MSGCLKAGALIAMVTLSSPLLAEPVSASKMQYSNNGAYVAALEVEYKVPHNGGQMLCRVKPQKDNTTGVGASVTIDLSIASWTVARGIKSECLDRDKKIPEGTEVWGRVLIAGGTNETCRKDKAVLYSPLGGTIKYKSGGTTFNNNRCKVASWP